MLISVMFALLPVLVVAWFLLVRQTSADISGGVGLFLAIALAWLWFDTAPNVIAGSLIAGVIGSLPVALVLCASLFQISVMQQTGALQRIVAFMKALTPGQQSVQILLINMAFGVLLTSLGAATVSIFPPLLLALGYSTFAAVLLPCIGYTAMCIYALLGIPAVVFAAFTGQSLIDVGWVFARYMPPLTLCVGGCMLLVTGGKKLLKEGLLPLLLTAVTGGGTCLIMAQWGLVTLTGIVAGTAMVASLLLYTRLRGLTLFDRSLLSSFDKEAEQRLTLKRACSPWIVLTIISLVLNAPFLPFFQLTFHTWAMPVDIIPGTPEKIRLFWQAYFWVFVSTFLCLPVLRITSAQLLAATRLFAGRAWRVFISCAVFFALAYVMNHSGKKADWSLIAPTDNMIDILALAAADAFGSLYATAAPFLGLLAGFISGSQTSAIAMFTRLHLATAQTLHLPGLMLAVASAMGGGLAGVISPAKVQSAAASIDCPDAAAKVMPTAFLLALLCTAVCALLTFFWTAS